MFGQDRLTTLTRKHTASSADYQTASRRYSGRHHHGEETSSSFRHFVPAAFVVSLRGGRCAPKASQASRITQLDPSRNRAGLEGQGKHQDLGQRHHRRHPHYQGAGSPRGKYLRQEGDRDISRGRRCVSAKRWIRALSFAVSAALGEINQRDVDALAFKIYQDAPPETRDQHCYTPFIAVGTTP